jgi:hypothetical protein
MSPEERARALCRDLLTVGISKKQLQRALSADGLRPALANYYLTRWSSRLVRHEVTPEEDPTVRPGWVRVDYQFRRALEDE